MKSTLFKPFRLLLALVLLGSALCPLASAAGAAADAPALRRVSALPEYEWQWRAAFPDWKGYTDDTLAMNSMLSFQGFHGQGTL